MRRLLLAWLCVCPTVGCIKSRAEAHHKEGVRNTYAGFFIEDEPHLAQAIQSLSRAIALRPNEARYFGSRGTANYWAGNYQCALADYTRAFELSKSATYLSERAEVRWTCGDLEGALADLNASAEEYSHGRGERAALLCSLERFELATEDLPFVDGWERPFWLWLIRYRNGEKELANKELSEEFFGPLSGFLPFCPWSLQMLLTTDSEYKVDQLNKMGYGYESFFMGCKYLEEGRTEAARELFLHASKYRFAVGRCARDELLKIEAK